MKYGIVKDENQEVQGCVSCGCEVPLASFDWGPPYNDYGLKERMLCEVCASTDIGTMTRHRSDNYKIAKVIAQVANLIIGKLEDSEQGTHCANVSNIPQSDSI